MTPITTKCEIRRNLELVYVAQKRINLLVCSCICINLVLLIEYNKNSCRYNSEGGGNKVVIVFFLIISFFSLEKGRLYTYDAAILGVRLSAG